MSDKRQEENKNKKEGMLRKRVGQMLHTAPADGGVGRKRGTGGEKRKERESERSE